MAEKKEAGKKPGSWLPDDAQEHLKAAHAAKMENLCRIL